MGIIFGVLISVFYSWKMALITLAMTPFILVSGILMGRLQFKQPGKIAKKGDDPYQMSNALLADIIVNYRTVIGFGEKNVEYLLQKYDNLLEKPNTDGVKTAHIEGFLFGYSNGIRNIFIGVVFYIASQLIYNSGENQ